MLDSSRSGALPRGRPKKPIVGFGPVAAFAECLRLVRQAAGNPTYRQMARKGNQSASALSTADAGAALPSWECTRAYLRACGVDDSSLAEWQGKRENAERAARRLTPDLSAAETVPELVAPLIDLMTGLRLAADTVTSRIDSLPGPPIVALPTQVPSTAVIAEVLAGRRPIGRDVLGYLVFACGGTATDVTHWLDGWDRLAASPAPAVHPPPDTTTAVATLPDPPRQPAPPSMPRAAVATRHRVWAGRRRRVAGIVALCAVAAVALVTAAAATAERRPGRPAGPPRGGSGALPLTGPDLATSPVGTRDKLLDLMLHIGQASEPAVAGRYTYIHLRTSSRDTTSEDAAQPETVTDEHLWWAPDLSGRRTTTISTGGPARPAQVERFLPGELPIVVRSPSDVPDTLRNQLASEQPPDTGAAGTLRAIAGVSAYHLLTRAQRAAVLRVLADTDGLTYRGPVPDAAGRAGIAISANTRSDRGPDIRDTLIFDADTAHLLSHETATVPAPPAATATTTISVVLYLARTRTDHLG